MKVNTNIQRVKCKFSVLRILTKVARTYRTSSVTHPDVAFDIQSRSSGKPERFHMSVDQRLVHRVGHTPRPLEFAGRKIFFFLKGRS